eukprot:TRINITY_DN10978_c0_g1_i12.p1 TRINITY_DN10978_c0_g1~~TRINITY_DN10978_c0_g1_i12.p1  ORF type:complete len:154 (+),score=59.84 TRINITY_DN10978_c0_g1_i12:25-462(+)
MIRRPPRSTHCISSAASDVYKRQVHGSSFAHSSKELAHLYEIGGGRAFADLIQIPAGPSHYENTAMMIVLDLSKLGALLDSLTFWLEAVRKAIAPKSYEETKEDSLKGIVNKVWVMHEDRKYIDLMPVPVMVVGNKYDEFIKEDP